MSNLHLTEADVLRRLDPAQLCAALESAFRDRYPSISLPSRTHAELAHGIFLAMSCYDGAAATLGMKLVLVRDHAQSHAQSRVDVQADVHAEVQADVQAEAQPDNPANAGAALTEGRVQATYLLLDPETAQPRLTIAANYLTDLRKCPEIAPVTFIVIAASIGATSFMSWKLFNTPDVTVNPARPYHWQQYRQGPAPADLK